MTLHEKPYEQIGGEGIGSHVELNYRSDRLYFYARNAVVSRDYRAEAGFVPRTDTIITSAGGYPILRPAWKPDWIRSMEPDLFVTVYQRASDRRFEEAFIPVAPLFLSLANGGTARVYVDSEHHRLDEPFSPLPGLTVNAGAYDFLRYGVSFSSDQSRRVRGSVRLEDGAFYAGERRRIETSLTYAPSPRAAFGVSWQQNAIRGLGPQRTDVRSGASAVVRIPAARQAFVERLFVELEQANNARAAASLLTLVLHEIRGAGALETTALTRPAGSVVGDVRYIERHCLAPLTLQDVASAVGLSPA